MPQFCSTMTVVSQFCEDYLERPEVLIPRLIRNSSHVEHHYRRRLPDRRTVRKNRDSRDRQYGRGLDPGRCSDCLGDHSDGPGEFERRVVRAVGEDCHLHHVVRSFFQTVRDARCLRSRDCLPARFGTVATDSRRGPASDPSGNRFGRKCRPNKIGAEADKPVDDDRMPLEVPFRQWAHPLL